MSKIISSLENPSESLKYNENEILIKIKLFLKITRLVVDNSKIALNEFKSEMEIKFFTM